MRAVLMERGRLWLDDLPDPVPGPGEVLVRTLACGICGSDLHAAQHTEAFVSTSREAGGAFKLTSFEPVVLGHEFAAELLDYGPDCSRTVAPGTAVCALPVLLRQPPPAIGYSPGIPGGFAETMILSERLLRPIPGGLDPAQAAMTEPLAVARHAVNRAALSRDDAAVVIGCGPVGLAVITVLKASGFGPVVASDFSPLRRALAEQLGADVIVDAATEDPVASQSVRGRDGLTIFECVGVPGMLDRLCLSAPQNARIVVVGVCLQADQFRPLIAINKELTLSFVLGYSPQEFSETLTEIADGTLSVAPLITDQIALAEVPTAFEALAQPDASGKVIVEPGRA